VFAQVRRDTVLTVTGDVDQPYVLSSSEFAKLPHISVQADQLAHKGVIRLVLANAPEACSCVPSRLRR